MNPNHAAVDLIKAAAHRASAQAFLPESTYRLQFHAGFTFRDAIAILPYLRDLGITHCYASPYLKSQPGSTHGYDVVDYAAINPEIGSAADHQAWTDALKAHGLGQILDFVPNHMGVGTSENTWWNDVLENGPASRFAAYFDIAWRASARHELQDKVLLPVLAEPYGDVLEAGGLRLELAGVIFSIHHENRRFPVAPASYADVLDRAVLDWERGAGPEDAALEELRGIVRAIRNLPDLSGKGAAGLEQHERAKQEFQGRLAALRDGSSRARHQLERTLAEFNGHPGDPRSFDLLDLLLDRQYYRLAYWRVAPDEINYRRFFDVNDLAGVSMERPEVFEAAHALVLRWLAEGNAHGLRIDHPDGLYDPAQYFRRLQEHFRLACVRAILDERPGATAEEWSTLEDIVRADLASGEQSAWENAGGPSLYVLAEKILAARESLVESWPISGTTGYEFLNQVGGLFVDQASAVPMARLYQSIIDDDSRFPEVAYRNKLLVLRVSLSSELHMLTQQLDRLAQQSRRSRDFTFNILRHVLAEVIACFPVYRSYVDDHGAGDFDRRYVDTAVGRARYRNPLLSRRVFRFLREILLADVPQPPGETDRLEQRRFAGKFQQVTSPVAAKGLEDTAFYAYNRLVSLNEVGGDPSVFGVKPGELHEFNQRRQARWPFTLSPLSTHDAKRSEDVRARINILSQIPQEWGDSVERWRRWNEPFRQTVDDATAPDPNEEYLLYQTLIGAWPLAQEAINLPDNFVKRIQEYMVKAIHEAKVHSSWLNPDADYDEAIRRFVALILDREKNQPFLDDFRALQAKISHFGLLESLAQTLLKLASPGVPDTYQGTEIWNFSLVDPDNRRPVDYALRQAMLRALESSAAAAAGDRRELCSTLLANKDDGRIKLYVHRCALQARRAHPGLFTTGEYHPVKTRGTRSDLVFAFDRGAGPDRALVATPRLWTRVIGDRSDHGLIEPGSAPEPYGSDTRGSRKDIWQDTRLILNSADHCTRWYNVFTGEILMARGEEGELTLAGADVFAHFPIALLLNERIP
jgi:(1->4)-alpha-D-glucan 1-alpha-D-glucosylmutase